MIRHTLDTSACDRGEMEPCSLMLQFGWKGEETDEKAQIWVKWWMKRGGQQARKLEVSELCSSVKLTFIVDSSIYRY